MRRTLSAAVQACAQWSSASKAKGHLRPLELVHPAWQTHLTGRSSGRSAEASKYEYLTLPAIAARPCVGPWAWTSRKAGSLCNYLEQQSLLSRASPAKFLNVQLVETGSWLSSG
ncbi:hypothetical protein WJX74_002651 [Apatococcus lobatus]|uniref:Uncharacterized protein n=1 Tax=Apatococcus lobatus TaxID=904363 RepID=A0AAW1RG50_9CHLO